MSDGWVYAPPAGPVPVLHHDRDLLVVDKPSGLLSVPGREHPDCARTRVCPPGTVLHDVHRLDLDTSGVLLFATRKKALRHLMAQFRDRTVQKTYLAWVHGEIGVDHGIFDDPLSRVPGRPRSVVDPVGKPARTRFHVEHRAAGATLVRLHPETGRSHQLRVHLAHAGHPILGDRFYAPPEVVAQAPRLLLHAHQLTVDHPWSGDRLPLTAPAPFSLESPDAHAH